MSETQNIEYKISWRDEYLKWICGFANANGGRIFIGKDDAGNVVDLKDSKRLLEDIPNKVKDTLGILVDVNLHKTANGDFIEIVVEAYPYCQLQGSVSLSKRQYQTRIERCSLRRLVPTSPVISDLYTSVIPDFDRIAKLPATPRFTPANDPVSKDIEARF